MRPLSPAMMLALLLPGAGCRPDYEVARKRHKDTFLQPSREGGVDILWIVDNSGSMYEEQEQLGLHAESFVTYLGAAPVDFRLGVASTDVTDGEPGRLVGEPLSAETEDLIGEFATQVAIPEGDRDEQGFAAAALAAEPGGINPEFAREDADLEVIFFSDEDDHSAISAEELVEQLQAGRPDAAVVLNAIVGDPPEGCASMYGAADAGVRYVEAQEESGGARESICSSEYGAMLERIALQVLGLDTEFAPSAVPDPATLEVRVDGVLVAERERHGWQYDIGHNVIRFDGYAVPRPGSSLVIEYLDWVGPSLEDL